MTYLLILLPIAAIIVWLVRKERSRRVQTQKNEAEFLASMRANPTAKSAPLEARPEPPVLPINPAIGRSGAVPAIVPTASAPSADLPVLPIEVASSGLPVPDITPRTAVAAPLAAPLGAPRDGRCMVCGEPVDVRSNDQSRWGVKIPEPASERLVWVHFHCLAARLADGDMMRSALSSLVTALDSGASQGALAPAEVQHALQDAKRALGP